MTPPNPQPPQGGEQKHTPTPWAIEDRGGRLLIGPYYKDSDIVANPAAIEISLDDYGHPQLRSHIPIIKANAALIVHRVNGWEALAASHAELVTALETLLKHGAYVDQSDPEKAQAALLRAREVNT